MQIIKTFFMFLSHLTLQFSATDLDEFFFLSDG